MKIVLILSRVKCNYDILIYEEEAMNMLISGVTTDKEGKNQAHVRFEEGDCFAEGVIPECKVTKQKGFSEDEIRQLEDYLRANLTSLKKEAAKINPLTAMMKNRS